MADLKHDLNILASIAKIDKILRDHQSKLEKIPPQIDKIDKTRSNLEKSRQRAIDNFEAMQKERKVLEQKLQDKEQLLTTYKGQLMGIKANKDYQAMLKQIETLEADIDTKEERLLELMDEWDSRGEEHENELARLANDDTQHAAEKGSLEERSKFLETEIKRLEAEKSGHLKDLQPSLEKKYKRLLDNLGGLPAARIEDGNCGGCRAKLPPQLTHEVSKNDQLITCEACGRILIYYSD